MQSSTTTRSQQEKLLLEIRKQYGFACKVAGRSSQIAICLDQEIVQLELKLRALHTTEQPKLINSSGENDAYFPADEGGQSTSGSVKREHRRNHSRSSTVAKDGSRVQAGYEKFSSQKHLRKMYTGENFRGHKVVSRNERLELEMSELVVGQQFSNGTQPKVFATAAQAFNVTPNDLSVGYCAGKLVLPPRGTKEPEEITAESQIFTVVDCQYSTMEVVFSSKTFSQRSRTRRFCLKKGDMFRVHPGLGYRLENKSLVHNAVISWTVIRPILQDPRQQYREVNRVVSREL